MSTLARFGLAELAFGATLGWLVTMWRMEPESLRRFGITSPRRVLQAHLDYLMMGTILLAVNTVAGDVATVFRAALIAGTIVNPGMFLVMAFREDATKRPLVQLVTVLSFIATSGSLIAIAITA